MPMTANFITKINVISIYNFDWVFLLTLNQFRQFCIPIFVMISGALLVNKDYSLSNFIKKKFNRIFISYIFWAIVLVLFSYILINLGINANVIDSFSMEYVIKSILGFTKGFQKGVSFGSWMILTVYLILFIMNKILKPFEEEKKKKIINLLVLIFTIYCLIVIPFDLINLSPYKSFVYYYISFAGYGILGYYLAKTDFTNIGKLKLSSKTVLLVSSVLFILSFIYFLIDLTNLSIASNEISGVNYFTFITLLLSSSIFLSFRYFEEANEDDEDSLFMKIKNGKLGILINSISKCSFGIYFVHPLVYIFYKDIVFGSIDILKHNPIKWSSLMIVLVLFTSWGIIWIMSKIPYLEKVSGA